MARAEPSSILVLVNAASFGLLSKAAGAACRAKETLAKHTGMLPFSTDHTCHWMLTTYKKLQRSGVPAPQTLQHPGQVQQSHHRSGTAMGRRC